MLKISFEEVFARYEEGRNVKELAKDFSVSYRTMCRWFRQHEIKPRRVNQFSDIDATERFWKFVEKTPSCWLWKGNLDKGGYGLFWDGQKTVRAHRFSWRIHRGEIPDGLLALHHCDNPPCVKPDDLFLGTHKDNAVDRDSKRRHGKNYQAPSRNGELNGAAKLTSAQVLQIRELYKSGAHTHKSLAKMFGTAKSNIYLIVHRKKWVFI